jgi:N-acetylglucosamine kinase-like BadF-type ATPase
VIGSLLERAGLDHPAEHAALFLCGADVPADFAELEAAIAPRGWARATTIDNDTFALLRTGTSAADAVAVVCGAGINCVGRAAGGRVARYPSLGWETGDWGGGEMVGREAVFLAARAEDGRGEPTALAELVARHFGLATAYEVGEEVHYGRIAVARLGELAPAVVEAARTDVVARRLVERLADEIAAMVERSLRDLGLEAADAVLGGGMLRGGLLVELVEERLPAGARAIVVSEPPVLGAALAALDAAGAPASAEERLRAAFRNGLAPA